MDSPKSGGFCYLRSVSAKKSHAQGVSLKKLIQLGPSHMIPFSSLALWPLRNVILAARELLGLGKTC